jgi:hypothetical protein
VEKASKYNEKEVARQPTEALQRAVQAEFAALWSRWALEVLRNTGTLRKVLMQQHGALGQWLSKDPLTPEDRESIALVMEGILANVDRVLTLAPEVPSAEEALIARLTAAHAAVPPTQAQPDAEAQTQQRPG